MENKDERGLPSSTTFSSDETSRSSFESISPDRQNKKRKYSSSETDDIAVVDSSEDDRKQTRPKLSSDNSDGSTISTSGAELRSSSESPVHELEIPSKTSDWNDQVFPNLRIELISEVFSPYIVFSSYSDFLENQKIKRSKIVATMNENTTEKGVLLDFYTHAMEHVLDLEYEHINHVPVHRVQELYKNIKCRTLEELPLKGFAESDLKDVSDVMKTKMKRMNEKMSEFLWMLLYMVNKRQASEPEELTEGMYQELFIRFAEIFDLHLIGVPCVGRYNFDVCKKEVSSVPDALIIDPLRENVIFGVVEVKKYYSKESDSQTERTLRSGIKVHNAIQHVNSKLKGQLVGEILSVLKHSLFGPTGIFGLVVQASEVTLVAFATDDKYMDCLKNGRLPKRDCATVKYSEKCNILSKKGRVQLVKTFLDMATLMQCL